MAGASMGDLAAMACFFLGPGLNEKRGYIHWTPRFLHISHFGFPVLPTYQRVKRNSNQLGDLEYRTGRSIGLTSFFASIGPKVS